MTRLLPLLLLAAGCTKSADRVVLYSAQDREFAEPLVAEFERDHTLSVAPKWDTEANKSVSLAAELLAEKSRPRADVHWNNEPLNTIRLARAGVYEPLPFDAGFPDWTRPADRTWQAFAARARVLIVNTTLVPDADRPKSLLELTEPKWKNRVAMAKPQFGTTATQAACLFEALGPDAAKDFYRRLRANGVQLVPGNKQAATEVSAGRYAVGLTDTDDALIELNAGKPVAVISPDREPNPRFPKLGVLLIPNTVAVVKGGPNPAGARRLAEYLLRPETERRLATAGGFQIPLHAAATVELHPALPRPDRVKRMEVDFEKAADRWDEVQAFLRDEFAR